MRSKPLVQRRRSEIADAADVLREKVDMLLDRAADKIIKAPIAGSGAWHAAWADRESAAGRVRVRDHLLARIAIAHHLGLDATSDINAVLAAGATPDDVRAAGAGRGNAPVKREPRHRSVDNQLTLFPA